MRRNEIGKAGRWRVAIAGWLAIAALHAGAQDLLLEHAHIVDPESWTITDGNIWIHDQAIKRIGTDTAPGFRGKKIDLTGRWVVPAFADMHAHTQRGNFGPGPWQKLTPLEVARLCLYDGVASVVDLFADEKVIFPARDRQRREGLPGADIYAAGPMLTCTNGHGSHFEMPTRIIDTPDQARAQITDLVKKRHPDFIKIAYDHANPQEYTSMNLATLQAAVATANHLGIKAIIHIGTWQDAKEAVQAGAPVITHLYGEVIPDDLVALMRERHVVEIPTMTYQTEMLHLSTDRSWLDSPLLVAVASPGLLAAYHTFSFDSSPYLIMRLGQQRQWAPSYAPTLKKLSDAGIPLLTGTDAGGDVGVFQAFSVHREMQIFVDSGLSPWQALAGSTTLANSLLGRPSGIRVGSPANLVVLSGSPIDDIHNTQAITLVIQRGRIVDRDALLLKKGPGIAITKKKPTPR